MEELEKRRGEFLDIFLAATMLDNGIAHIITLSENDFVGIKGLSVYNPWRKD